MYDERLQLGSEPEGDQPARKPVNRGRLLLALIAVIGGCLGLLALVTRRFRR